MTKDELKSRILDDYNLGPMHVISLVESFIEGRKVSRKWVEEYFEGGLVDTAIKMLREAGVEVKE